MEQQMNQASGVAGADRKRVQVVVETLATLRGGGESLAEVAHDARNMVTALGLYCDLLEEPGVLATPFVHYGNELRLVAAASRRLVEKLVTLDSDSDSESAAQSDLQRAGQGQLGLEFGFSAPAGTAGRLGKGVTAPWLDRPGSGTRRSLAGRIEVAGVEGSWNLMPTVLIENLAEELLANRDLLAALAGPAIGLKVDVKGGALPVQLMAEDLTRVLVNLVKNAAEAMPAGGRIRLGLSEEQPQPAAGNRDLATRLRLTIEDSGPGIPEASLESVFEAGFSTHSTHSTGSLANGGWATAHRGLGLSITRSIVEAAGGSISVENRAATGEEKPGGACFAIQLPVRVH